MNEELHGFHASDTDLQRWYMRNPYSVNHSRETVAALGYNVDDASTVFAHISVKGSLAHVESSVEVQVDDSGESLGAQHASRRHELSTGIVLCKRCNS